MMKEYAAYDKLPAKQSVGVSLHNNLEPSWMRQLASPKSSLGKYLLGAN